MQIQQLAYFLAVAESLHFTRAAERVHVAQPSLSKQIHNLEIELGSELFHRVRGNVSLTPAGETLVPFARRILADVENARLQVHELAELRRGRLRLGATPSLCTGLLADALARFRSSYPGIELVVIEQGSRDLVHQVSEGAIDLAVITSALPQNDSALVSEPILIEQLAVAVARDAEPDLAVIRMEDLRDRPLVMFREGYDLREMTLSACQQAGFEPTFAAEGGEMDAVLSFVQAGLGIAVVPSMVLPGRPGLRGIPFTEPVPTRTIALTHRTGVRPSRAVEAFRSTLLGLLRTSHRNGTLPPGVALVAEPPSRRLGQQSSPTSTVMSRSTPRAATSSRTTRKTMSPE